MLRTIKLRTFNPEGFAIAKPIQWVICTLFLHPDVMLLMDASGNQETYCLCRRKRVTGHVR